MVTSRTNQPSYLPCFMVVIYVCYRHISKVFMAYSTLHLLAVIHSNKLFPCQAIWLCPCILISVFPCSLWCPGPPISFFSMLPCTIKGTIHTMRTPVCLELSLTFLTPDGNSCFHICPLAPLDPEYSPSSDSKSKSKLNHNPSSSCRMVKLSINCVQSIH